MMGRRPGALCPESTSDGGLHHDPQRVKRKRWQLESIYIVLERVVEHALAAIAHTTVTTTAATDATAATTATAAANTTHTISAANGTTERSTSVEPKEHTNIGNSTTLDTSITLGTSTTLGTTGNARGTPQATANAKSARKRLLHVVDFGSGSGNSALPFVSILCNRMPRVSVIPPCAAVYWPSHSRL